MNNKRTKRFFCERVLVVDDEEQTRTMVERALKKFWPELDIAQAGDGIQAVQKAKEFLPHLVILDLMLPCQDGFAVLKAMTQDPNLKSSLVLGITAYNSPENIQSLMTQGAIDCLAKPFGPDDLKRLLSPYLDGEAAMGDEKKEVLIKSMTAKAGKATGSLVNATILLGIMMSTFSLRGTSEAASLSKNAQIEEPYRKGTLPFKRIAVLPFESWNEYLSGNTLSDYFVHNLIRTFPEVTVVERRELQKIFKEQLFSRTGAVNSESVNKIGEILGVDAILVGKVTTLDTIVGNRGAISIVYRLINMNTGQVIWSDKQNAKMKPKLLQLESNYKSPMEVAEALLDQVAQKSIEQLRLHFFDIASVCLPSSSLYP
ncbi:MAG: DUF799 family lipoprotein [Elusimicrobia bacterium]|nr:DUF799 family lipoprotein [Candidatus Obscuribacterium magneticum]